METHMDMTPYMADWAIYPALVLIVALAWRMES